MISPDLGNLLHGKVAFVTGAAKGIGLAVSTAYFQAGAIVILADLSHDSVAKAAAELNSLGTSTAVGLTLDVTDEDATNHACEEVIERFGCVDCVVANAGVLALQHTVDISLSDWQRVLEVNLTGAFLTTRVFARRMIERQRGGRIIVTSSLFGLRGGVENCAYSASKFGMIGLAQCLAAELAPHDILVNAVCPGQMNTDMLTQLFRDRAVLTGTTDSAVRAKLVSRIPIARLGEMDELVGTYLFLASDLSRYMTGQALVVDGGWQVG